MESEKFADLNDKIEAEQRAKRKEVRKINLSYDCGCNMQFELLGKTVRLDSDLSLCPIHSKQLDEIK